MNVNLTAILQGALAAVARTDEIIRDHWDKPRRVTLKGRIDLVTETDVAVETELKQLLAHVLPGCSFLAEETANEAFSPPNAPGASGVLETLPPWTWIIDPVDGTTNFAHKLPMTATSVGLWDGERVCLGIVSVPILGETFWAVRGKGAFLNGEPISVTTTHDLVQSLIATGFPYTVREECDELVARLAKVLPVARGVRRMGAAAVDLAYTSCGRFDAYYEAGLKPWDTAAGWVLVEEAGGRVSQYDPATDYKLGARTILATNKHVHDDLEGVLEL